MDAIVGEQTMRIDNQTGKMSQLERAKRAAKSKNEIDRVAEDYEAVFLSQMLQHMFAGVDLDPTADGPGEDIYKSMMVDEYGKILARSGGIGVADYVKREMLKMQEVE